MESDVLEMWSLKAGNVLATRAGECANPKDTLGSCANNEGLHALCVSAFGCCKGQLLDRCKWCTLIGVTVRCCGSLHSPYWVTVWRG